MRLLSSLGIGLSLASGFLLLVLIAELYYFLWWKKRIPSREKKPIEDQHGDTQLKPGDKDECLETELMRVHGLAGPARLLFTIKEETMEDLESDDGRSVTPFMTPLTSPMFFTPPMTPRDCYNHHGFNNPLFESTKDDNSSRVVMRSSSSPPPKFKFLKDAEDKLYRRTLMEEALKVKRNGEEGEGSFITIAIAKNRESSSSSQVIPFESSPSKIRSFQGRPSSNLSLNQ